MFRMLFGSTLTEWMPEFITASLLPSTPIRVSNRRCFFLALSTCCCRCWLLAIYNYVASLWCLSLGLLLFVMALFLIGANCILFFLNSRGEPARESMILRTRSLVDANSGIFRVVISGLLSLFVLSVSCLWYLGYYRGSSRWRR